MGITDVLNELFGIENSGAGHRPSGGNHSAFIAPTLKPASITKKEILFESPVLFTGGNFMFSDFRMRITPTDKVELQTKVHFGKMKTGHQAAPSPIVAFAFADKQGFFLPEKWVLDRFAKHCSDSENQSFSDSTTIDGVYNHTKQLGAMHSAWAFAYC